MKRNFEMIDDAMSIRLNQALPLQRGSRQEGVVRRNGSAQKRGKVATKTGFLIFNDCFQMKQLQHSHVVNTC
jgi:hypothetical protein